MTFLWTMHLTPCLTQYCPRRLRSTELHFICNGTREKTWTPQTTNHITDKHSDGLLFNSVVYTFHARPWAHCVIIDSRYGLLFIWHQVIIKSMLMLNLIHRWPDQLLDQVVMCKFYMFCSRKYQVYNSPIVQGLLLFAAFRYFIIEFRPTISNCNHCSQFEPIEIWVWANNYILQNTMGCNYLPMS